MKVLDIHEQIDRYVTGAMGPTEEQLFKDRIAHDPQVRALVEAEQLCQSTLRSEGQVLQSHDPAAYATFLGMLAASSAPVTATSVPTLEQKEEERERTAVWKYAFAGLLLLLIGLFVGRYIVPEITGSNSQSSPITPSVQQETQIPRPSQTNTQAEDHAMQPKTESKTNSSKEGNRNKGASPVEQLYQQQPKTSTVKPTQKQPEPAYNEDRTEPPVFTSDTVRTHLQIKQ